jgi:hypothetical protein
VISLGVPQAITDDVVEECSRGELGFIPRDAKLKIGLSAV